jgi:cytidylate kinase
MTKIITIDGPSSSGKGTVAKLVAKKLGFNYLDSGALYRSIAYIVSHYHIDQNNINLVLAELKKHQLSLCNNVILLDNIDITMDIRDELIGMLSSKLATNYDIRKYLLSIQRDFAKDNNLVTDGRDMGSVVFPNANLKVFLTADIEVRANRRFSQLQNMGKYDKIDTILLDIQTRDKSDSSREEAPLQFDDSYKLLDNTNLSIEDTVDLIISWYADINKSL